MPLSERARIEGYLPDLPTESSQNLLDTFETEFTYALGGCTIIRGLDGSYLSRQGIRMRDRVNVIYSDTPFKFEDHVMSRYTEELRRYAFEALDEETILIVVVKVLHPE